MDSHTKKIICGSISFLSGLVLWADLNNRKRFSKLVKTGNDGDHILTKGEVCSQTGSYVVKEKNIIK